MFLFEVITDEIALYVVWRSFCRAAVFASLRCFAEYCLLSVLAEHLISLFKLAYCGFSSLKRKIIFSHVLSESHSFLS